MMYYRAPVPVEGLRQAFTSELDIADEFLQRLSALPELT